MKRTRLGICRRKLRHATFAEARAAASAAALASGLVLRAYRCDKCRHYHLTSRRKP
ncbi:hypothetical protein ACFOD9_12595 [Novosphingobium bradum]|uniref:Uncharacterized protein n=1 Tax=Novosphingobium bradum TaxID=1737444 RepID=A0ABV7IU91_9SPHN